MLAVYVPTRKEFNRLMQLLHNQGIQVAGRDIRNWGIFREGYKMTVSIEGHIIGYCYEQWYWDNGYTVISLAEYEEILKPKFKVGDVVCISDPGKGYSTFTRWAELHGATAYVKNRYATKDQLCTIISMGSHLTSNEKLALVRNNTGSEFIMGIEGLALEYKKEKKVGRRTFRLKKATEWLKKGAIFQEACDDGDQEYTLLDSDFIRFDDASEYELGDCSRSRKGVEENPQWFEEVFPATETWLSETELKKFKEFLKA